MKKFAKVMLIVASVFAVFGFGLSLGGVAMGASMEGDVVSGIRKNVKNAVSFVRLKNDWDWDDDDWDDHDRGSDSSEHNKTESTADSSEYNKTESTADSSGNKIYTCDVVKEIEIDLYYDELIMQAYDGDVIRVEVENDGNGNVQVKSDTRELKIESKKKATNRTVTLYYPKNAEFSKVEIDIDAGSGSLLDDLTADELEINVGAGEFTGDGQIISTKADLEVGVGSLDISGLTAREISGECGIGELNLYLSGSASDYNCELECGVGEINFDGESYSGLAREKRITNDSASRRLELECGMGEINVVFEG